ncbi:enolase C-terminal domain-like protein [Tautonia sociabilis]|uniref:Starvation-sensing protein RspA n=1 Tax=Tautonia sociabilis TaxID=2080755 RepID=A0A432MNI1_9BACT|nr:enolase C-terminal domain-like protein [Tautonia sociabilis]RUL88666.1 starvation-sensing protein RspA [Tautonia sociabilis]
MNRRDVLGSLVAGAGLLASSRPARADDEGGRASAPGAEELAGLTIRDVRAILTAPSRIRLVVVKVETNQDGLYGLGCATFTQRARLVAAAVDQFLKPFLVGKSPLEIDDTWQSSLLSSYWRHGPVLNNAISGVDMALWDILGKVAGLPVYRLFGGKCREKVPTYRSTGGESAEEVEEGVRALMEQGQRHVRVQYGGRGGGTTYGVRRNSVDESAPENRRTYPFDPVAYARQVPRLFEHLRDRIGDEIELLHDVHERIPPVQAIRLVKEVEPYRPFFIEDPFSPEDGDYFAHLRSQTAVPLAMGELFTNPREYLPLISGRLIDFIRIHISMVGGLTPARKIASLCEFFGVKTAWHGPGDLSPVGHAANIHLDLAVPNFGIQEGRRFSQAERDVFPGAPELVDGCYQPIDRPGIGVDLDEELAARFPVEDDPPFDMHWGNLRLDDGTVIRP